LFPLEPALAQQTTLTRAEDGLLHAGLARSLIHNRCAHRATPF
jgi:hypothetical protein